MTVTEHLKDKCVLNPFMISGFQHEVDENCTLLGYYAANNGIFLPMFWVT
jgi:hypothetical protein